MRSRISRAPTLAILCVIGLFTPFLSRLLADAGGAVHWLMDLAAHWQWLYLSGLLVLVAIAARRDRRWLLLLLALPLPWVAASPRADSGDGPGPVLTIVSANLGMIDGDPARLIDWVRSEGADIVVLLEVSPGMAESLASL